MIGHTMLHTKKGRLLLVVEGLGARRKRLKAKKTHRVACFGPIMFWPGFKKWSCSHVFGYVTTTFWFASGLYVRRVLLSHQRKISFEK